jgi:peroxiredoxin
MSSRWCLVGAGFLLALTAGPLAFQARVSPSGKKTADATLRDFRGREHAPSGRKTIDFTLRDFRGQEHALSEHAGLPVVIVFVSCQCPLSQLYGPRLVELAREFEPSGVAFLGIAANAKDTLTDVAAFARQTRIPFPILLDPDQAVADQVGAERTPEVFLLDRQRVVRYRGRIDDQHNVGVQGPRARQSFLARALEDVLADRPVAQPLAPAVGCQIGRLPRIRPHGDVTWHAQVRPILNRRCLECHRTGEIGPFPLDDFRSTVAWSGMIREVVEQGRMPPWLADPTIGRFHNDARLTAEEKRLLFAWIDNGCPEGNPEREPAEAFPFPTGWRIPAPDQVIHMADKPFSVPAEGELEYQYFEVDPGFKETRYLQAAEVRPGCRAVVHHALVAILPPGAEPGGLDTLGALLDYAPGMPPTLLPPGQAVRVPAGSRFLFQIHYTPNGRIQQDRSYLGLVFADPKTVTKVVKGGAVINAALEIPPGARNHRVTAEQVLGEDIRLLSLSPHAHLRGKSFRFEAVLPDGRRQVLLDVPRWDFHWQLRYDLAEPLRLPGGSRLICTAVYDNSADNPHNPDPQQTVTWGDQTWQEMLIGFYTYVAD